MEQNLNQFYKEAHEIKVVTPIVHEIQAGNSDKWLELIEEIDRFKQIVLYRYNSITRFVSVADVEAKFDDTLMYGVANFDSSKEPNFVKYLYGMLQKKLPDLKAHSLRDKRAANVFNTSIDAPVDMGATDSPTIADTLVSSNEDDNRFSMIDDGLTLLSWVEDYSKESSKATHNTTLILAAAMNEEGTEERKTAMLSVLPEGTSWASARQKLSRARADFKQYLLTEGLMII